MSNPKQIIFILMVIKATDAHMGVLQPMARQLVNMPEHVDNAYNAFTNNQGPEITGLDKYGGVILPGQEAPMPAYSMCYDDAPKWDSDTCKFHRKWWPLFGSNTQMYAPGWSKLDPKVQKDVCAGGQPSDVPTARGKKTVSQMDIKPGQKRVPFKSMIGANHWGFYRFYLAANESCAREWDCYKNTPLNFTEGTLNAFDMCDAGSDAISFETCKTYGCKAKSTCAGNWVNLTRNEYQEGWQWIPRHWGDFHGTNIDEVMRTVRDNPHYDGPVFENNPSIVTDYLDFPDDVPLGDATILWRWETQSQPNTWTNCVDVKFVDSSRDGYSCNEETQQCKPELGGTYTTQEACDTACKVTPPAPPPKEDKYICNSNSGQCKKSAHGNMTEEECSNSCAAKPSEDKYACDTSTYTCKISSSGDYKSKEDCSKNCQEKEQKFACDMATQTCSESDSGDYASRGSCENACKKTPPKSCSYICLEDRGKCVPSSSRPFHNGTKYPSRKACMEECDCDGVFEQLRDEEY